MNETEGSLIQKKNKTQTENFKSWLNRIVLSLLISMFFTSTVACLLALIPTGQEESQLPKRILKEQIKTEISKVKNLEKIDLYRDSLNLLVNQIIDKSYNVNEDETGIRPDSNLDFVINNISKEFSWELFAVLFFLILFYSNSITWKDYLPVSAEAKESGIHAKLNYQVIADRLSRKLALLMVGIIMFSIGFIFIIFKFSSEVDSIIHNDDIEAYETWINSIEFHVGKNNPTFTETEEYYKLIETNTELFWKVYFARFIIVRSFIALIVGSLITFLIRLYRKLRDDRELIIQKEEALSAIHYIARGEWRFRYDSLGKLLFEGIDGDKNKVIINEESFNKLNSIDKLKFKPLKLEILDEEDAKIETRELLNAIPIRELFRSSSDKQDSNSEMIVNLEDTTQQLNQIKDEFKNVISRLNKK